MRNSLSEKVLACRLCGHRVLDHILDATSQPPANSLRKPNDPLPGSVPLILCRCASCGTLQLTETVDPEYLFSHYVWVTGTSVAAHGYSQTFAKNVLSHVGQGLLKVLEVASNDGTFLRPFLALGHEVVGVDPAANIVQTANASGILTYPEFFGVKAAAAVTAQHGKFDVVFARNVLPHVKDANDVLAGMVSALAPGGLLAIEFHRADIILEDLHYDSIYHEHLFYHSLASIELLTKPHGLHVFDVTTSPISGGSYVAYFLLTQHEATPELILARAHEAHLGIQTAAAWHLFAQKCLSHRDSLRKMVDSFVTDGKKIVGFGASARSSTLLNFTGLNAQIISCIADNNPLKCGLLTPGTNIPIVSSRDAFESHPDVILLLAWNFSEEIIQEIKAVHGWAGTVLIPLPGEPQLREI